MNYIAQAALLGFPFIAFIVFAWTNPMRGVMITWIGGWLFLPQAGFTFPGVPDYDKPAAISAGIIVSLLFLHASCLQSIKVLWFDLPIILFCLCPIGTHLSNGSGIAPGINWAINHICLWGIPYACGRLLFHTTDNLRELSLGLILGGLVYAPLCWFEIFFSPKLHLTIYGFFQHNFLQHIRYGGYRPIVFMQHGIMVGVWMALTTLVLYCLWQDKLVRHMLKVPPLYWTTFLAGTTVACKAMSGLVALAAGVSVYWLVRRTKTSVPLLVLALTPIGYMGSRITGLLPMETVISLIEPLDQERAGSLGARMRQELLYINQAMKSPLFGFGNGDFIPKAEDGTKLVRGNDGFWIITTGMYGFPSLISIFIVLALPGIRTAVIPRNLRSTHFPYLVILSTVVSLFAIDLLFNAMINPIYCLVAGAVLSSTSFNTRA